jgi:hypothetical protein
VHDAWSNEVLAFGLSSATAKLGAANRREVVRVARARGWI